MKREFFLLIIVSLILSKLLGPASAGGLDDLKALRQARRFKPGEVLVKFAAGVNVSQVEASLAAKGLAIAGEIPSLDIKCLAVPPGQELMWIEELRGDPRLVFAELNYLAHAAETIPDDPHYTGHQWNLLRIRAPEAWDITTGDDLTIAIIDTGVDMDHPDLMGKLWTNADEMPGNGLDDDGNGKVDDIHGWHFYHLCSGIECFPFEDNNPQDDNGHGSHVAGIASAETNNGIGIAGISWGAKLMPVKVLDEYGEGWYSDIIKGIVYAVDNGAHIVNLSLGGENDSQALAEAVGYAHARGALLVAATGNDGGAVLYPAAYEEVLAVGATDEGDRRPSFSNHGPEVDVAAPGVDIYSTWPWRESYWSRSGTSMATAHVAGLAALVWSVRPDYTNDQVREVIERSADDVNSATHPGWDPYLGWGRINAHQALLNATPHQWHKVYLPAISS
jgi:subtilisin family serine protease